MNLFPLLVLAYRNIHVQAQIHFFNVKLIFKKARDFSKGLNQTKIQDESKKKKIEKLLTNSASIIF